MKFLAYLRSLAARLFRRAQLEGERQEELRSHIEHRADDLERSGLDRAEALRRALAIDPMILLREAQK